MFRTDQCHFPEKTPFHSCKNHPDSFLQISGTPLLLKSQPSRQPPPYPAGFLPPPAVLLHMPPFRDRSAKLPSGLLPSKAPDLFSSFYFSSFPFPSCPASASLSASTVSSVCFVPSSFVSKDACMEPLKLPLISASISPCT